MYETMVTLVGNAATAVEHRLTTTGDSAARFRLATSARRWDKERRCWVDGDPSFYTVRAWRSLADHLAASVSRGEPLVVHGRMRVWERDLPEEKGGQRRVSVEVDAVAVGHDLSRGTSAFRRINRTGTDPTPPNGRPGGGGGATDAAAPPLPAPSPSLPSPQEPSASPAPAASPTPAASPSPSASPIPADFATPPDSVSGTEPDWSSPPPTPTREKGGIASA